MSGKISLALLASASCLCFASEALAIDASTEPPVIYAGQPAPVRMASAERANMGGGFIEFLFGDAPQGGRYQQAPAYQTQPDYGYGGRRTLLPPMDPQQSLRLVQGDGKALRYGVGVGRPGFTWSGVKTVSAKKEWPAWTPPPEMLARRPDLPRHMEGGPQNPLGARAMYLGSSLYRIHGSNEPWTIGTNVSSGCIRMRNEDVIDLYGRVGVGAKVVVI
jgi:lipoprotein-anchoring transpeptidase ErfK/SrfK